MSDLENFIDSALEKYFQILNAKPQQGEEDKLLNFYNDQSKLTYGNRKLGAKNIVEELRKSRKEFTLDTYSYGSVDKDHVVITGQCIIGNKATPFTMALESQPGINGQTNIYITNQIINI